MGVIARVVASVAILACWGIGSGLVETASPLISGRAATWQLQNSDFAYVMSQYGMATPAKLGTFLAALALVLLLAVWWAPLRRVGKTAAVILLTTGLMGGQAWAYYATTDYPEWANILPNESAFLIPLQGGNKDSQAKFNSVEYLKDNKVPAKRVQIPHTALVGSGYVKDSVVPSAQLILVDRAPYQREWNGDPQKGTSSKNDGFRCESRDSYRIDTAVTIAAYVTEDDASAFLYHFGVNAPLGADGKPAKRDDPNIIFASTVFGRSLEQVMDSNVRGKVHAVLCRELARYDLNSVKTDLALFLKKGDIIAEVEKQVRELYKPMGITIEYLGFADELGYEKEIQTAINRVFKAAKEAEAALSLQAALPVLQAEADMEIKRGLAKGLETHGIPALPSFLLDPKTISEMIHGFFSGDMAATIKK